MLFSQVQIRSTVFIFVTVSITSLYNGGLKNGNFVVKIYDVKKINVLLLKQLKLAKQLGKITGRLPLLFWH
jgi:hypothetical protein